MAKVKCKYCGKDIDKKDAIVQENGHGRGRNAYYCCEAHSRMQNDRDVFYRKAMEIFGVTTNSKFFIEFDHIGKIHGFRKMLGYLKDNEGYLRSVLDKPFTSEYAKVRYFSVIVGNNMADYVPKNKTKEVVKIETDLHEMKSDKPKKEKEGLDSLLEGLLDD